MTKTITTVTAATSVWKIRSHPDGKSKAALTATHTNPAARTVKAVSGRPVKRSSPHSSRLLLDRPSSRTDPPSP
jgi:hypothetical protein